MPSFLFPFSSAYHFLPLLYNPHSLLMGLSLDQNINGGYEGFGFFILVPQGCVFANTADTSSYDAQIRVRTRIGQKTSRLITDLTDPSIGRHLFTAFCVTL